MPLEFACSQKPGKLTTDSFTPTLIEPLGSQISLARPDIPAESPEVQSQKDGGTSGRIQGFGGLKGAAGVDEKVRRLRALEFKVKGVGVTVKAFWRLPGEGGFLLPPWLCQGSTSGL